MQPNYRAQTRGWDCCTVLLLHTINTTPSPHDHHHNTIITTQVNMEYVALESRVITTDQDAALQEVFGDGVGSSMYKQAVMTCARRLATVFATLRVCMNRMCIVHHAFCMHPHFLCTHFLYTSVPPASSPLYKSHVHTPHLHTYHVHTPHVHTPHVHTPHVHTPHVYTPSNPPSNPHHRRCHPFATEPMSHPLINSTSYPIPNSGASSRKQ